MIPSPQATAETAAVPEADAFRQIMLQLSQAHRRKLAATTNAFNLTVPQYSVLISLSRAESPAGRTMSELAERTHQVAATMTGIVDRLVERDLVARHQDPADRRAWRVRLTARGLALVEDIERQQRDWTAALLAPFSAEDRSELLRLLGQYLDIMRSLPLD